MIDAYIAHVGLALPDPRRLGAFKLAIDAANGATTTVAPRLFRELGFDVEVLSASPDGRNINLDCGSTHPEPLPRRCARAAAAWVSRSTATATARSSSTHPAGSWMATPCS